MKTIEEYKNQMISIARSHEQKMLGLQETLENRGKSVTDSKLFQLYVGKMFGMIEMLEEMSIDTTEFHWAYEYGI
jgi:hypothetical protein